MKKLIPVLIAVFLLTVCLVFVGHSAISVEAGEEEEASNFLTDINLDRSNVVTVSIEPVSSTVKECNTFTVAIHLDTFTQSVDAFEGYIDFVTDCLQAEKIVSAGTFEIDFVRDVDNTAGTVRYAGGSIYSFPSGSFDVAYISFTAMCETETDLIFRDTIVPRSGFTLPLYTIPGQVEVMPNSIPSITDLNFIPVSPSISDSLTLAYVYDDDDGDPEGNTRIRWNRGDQTESLFTDKESVPGRVTLPGEEWCVSVTPHDGCDYGDTVEECVYIEYRPNIPPTALDLVIDPVNPTDFDDLELNYYEFNDADGDWEDKGRSLLRWSRNGIIQSKYNNLEVIPASETNPGETWCVTVRPHDGQDYGPVSESCCVLIRSSANNPPEVTAATIDPVNPEDDDNLVLDYDYYDKDGDDQESSSIYWYRNSQYQPAHDGKEEVEARFTLPGDMWYVTVRPHDGTEYGLWSKTGVVKVHKSTENTLPQITNPRISLVEPGESDNLRLVYDYTDVDGDPERDTAIFWYKVDNGQMEFKEEYTGLSVIPASDVSSGDTWFVKIIPSDGKGYGDPLTTYSAHVQDDSVNTPPYVYNVYLAPASPGLDDDLELNYSYYDADGDPEESTEVEWDLDGSPQVVFEDTTVIPSKSITIGQTWCATLSPHDGSVHGVSVKSNCVTVTENGTNTNPRAEDVYITPERPSSNHDLILHYNFIDQDDDLERGTKIQWYKDGIVQGQFDDQTVVPSSETETGQSWFVEVTPDDGVKEGASVTSIAVEINHPPVMEGLELVPSEPQSYDTLRLNYFGYNDEDGDPPSGLNIHWHIDGIEHPELYGMQYIYPDLTSSGQVWYATVAPCDGIECGEVIASNVVTIGDEGPFSGSICYLPIFGYLGSDWDKYYEQNDIQSQAYPLKLGKVYTNALPDDEDDWYSIFLRETSSFSVTVENYLPNADPREGQLVVYESLDLISLLRRWWKKVPTEDYDILLSEAIKGKILSRRIIANDGRGKSEMELPNEDLPSVLKNRLPGFYFIRVYTSDEFNKVDTYTLQVTHQSLEYPRFLEP